MIDPSDGTRETFPSVPWPHYFRRAFTDRLDYVVVATDSAAAIRLSDSHRSLSMPAMSGQDGSNVRVIGGRCLAGRTQFYDFETAQMTVGLLGIFQMNRDGELHTFIEEENRVVQINRTKKGGTEERPGARLGQSDGYHHLRWTDDGGLLWAVSDDQHSIRFWTAEDGTVSRTVDVSRADSETKLQAVALSQSGNFLAVVDGEFPKRVRVWSDSMTEPASEFPLPFRNAIYRSAISPDGNLFVTDRDANRDVLQLRDTRTGKIQLSLRIDLNTHQHALTFRFSPSGRYLLLRNRVWDLQGPQLVWEHKDIDRFIATQNRIRYRGAVWAGDDNHVLMAQDGRYTLWNWPENRMVATLAYLPASNWVAFNHQNGHWTGSADLHRYVQFRQGAAGTGSDRWHSSSDFGKAFKRTNNPQRAGVKIPSSGEAALKQPSRSARRPAPLPIEFYPVRLRRNAKSGSSTT